MSGTNWTVNEIKVLVDLAREGKSSAEIVAALSGQSARQFTCNTVRKKAERLRVEGVEVPHLGGKPGRPATSIKPKREKQENGERRRRRTSTIAGFQKLSMAAIRARCDYEPAAVIAGFPTIQIRRDVEGNVLAPVTLRRIDFGGAHA